MCAQYLEINDEFGVGGELDDMDVAFHSGQSQPAPAVPHFLQPAKAPARALHQNPYDPRLIVDLARNIEPVENIASRYGLSQTDLDKLLALPAFRYDLATTTRDLHETGEKFRLNAKAIAEQGLEKLDYLIHDDETPASVVLSIMSAVARWAGLEPEKDKGGDAAQGPTVNVQINIPNYN